MVLCSDVDNITGPRNNQTHPHQQKMASQFESCIGHLTKVYNTLKIVEPAVRCQHPACDWFGSYEEILFHCQQCHPQAIWLTGDQKREYTVKEVTSSDSYHVEMVVAYGRLFWLHIKNDQSVGHLYAACQQIVTENEDSHTKFMIRTELCDASKLNCISCSTETRPHTEDISKIFSSTHCTARSHTRLRSFISSDNTLTFSVNINKMYYFQ